MHRQPSGRTGIGLGLLSAATFATSGPFARSLTGAGWSPAAAVAARISVAAVILAAPAAVALRGQWALLRRSAAMLTVFGVLAVAGAQVCFFNALQTLSVGVALLLEYSGTVLVVGWMWLRHGHRPRRLTAAGSAIALLGLGLMLDLVAGSALDPVGVLWGLGAAIGLATYFVLSGDADNDLPPAAVASAGMIIGAVTLFAVGGFGALPLHATFGTVAFAGHRVSWLIPILGLSVVAAAFAYVAGIAAARLLGPRLASFLGLTEVVFAVLFAWLLLGELPTGWQLLGGLMIVVGIAFVRLGELSPILGAVPEREFAPPEPTSAP